MARIRMSAASSISSSVTELAGIPIESEEDRERARAEVTRIATEGDSSGGTVAVRAEGLPAGIGSPVFGKLTARAGHAGVAVSLCCVDDVSYLRGVERLLQQPLTVHDDHPWHSPSIAACLAASTRAAQRRARAGQGRGSGSKWAR